jgi:predicted helicase
LNLHGGKGFVRSTADDDENVFDIMQSVGIGFFVAPAESRDFVVYDECVGSRQHKYDRLLAGGFAFAARLEPANSNQWLFAPLSADVQPEWSEGISVEKVFMEWGAGVKTNRNGLAVGYTPADVESQIRDFGDQSKSDSAIEARYAFQSNYQWDTGKVRKKFAREGYDQNLVAPYLFRPFDTRHIYWHPSIVFNMRGDKMEVFRSKQAPIALLFSRTTIKDAYTNFFVSRLIADHDCLEKTKVAALMTGPIASGAGLAFEEPPQSNLSQGFLELLSARLRLEREPGGKSEELSQVEVFNYAYATFYSPEYRRRFADFLKIEFPRLLLPGNLALFRALARLGGELTALHLLESPKLAQPLTEFIGGRSPEVEKISWSRDTVWVDKAQAIGFKGVREEVWNFHIGGHQVCEKWLKDRKGRTLSKDDVAHYQKVIVALSETIRLMREIDEVIEQHGGWPNAFRSNG